MKRSLKILMALCAFFIATTGFAKTTQTKHEVSVMEQRNISKTGYLVVILDGGGSIIVKYTAPNGTSTTSIMDNGGEILAMAETTCTISAAPGSILKSISGDTTIRANEMSYVEVNAYKLDD